MRKMDVPKIEYMPSFIEGLKNGYRLDNEDPLTAAGIQKIENDPELFFNNFVERKTTLPADYKDADGNPIQRSEFWCVEENEFIGRLNLRHALNEKLLNSAGNLGFEVVPKYQQQGHASFMLNFGLDFFRHNTEVDKVLIITSDSNFQSIGFIEKHQGILEDKIQRPDNTWHRRYWITL